jgi:class 3 adenylate cyclase
MNQTASVPRLACIVFVRIRDFSRMPVRLQVEQGNALHVLVEMALARLPADQRLLLDVPGGAAIVVPDDPLAALDLGEQLQAHAAALALCIGLNYGPVKLAGETGVPALIGDGLEAAATVAQFAAPERLLAARPFRDALQQAAPEQAGRLVRAGIFTDTQVRSHELYALDTRVARSRKWRVWLGGALAIACILGLGVGARLLREPPKPEPPALVMLDIRPHGDVWVDGLLRGHSPPLAEFELPAGHHQIQVKNGNLPPFDAEMDLQSGERITVAHKFNQPQRPAQQPQRKSGVFQDLRRKLGL